MRFINTKVIINLISIQIVIISYKFLSKIVKIIKMVYFKHLKTNLNMVQKQ